ncbi:hypothetical protein GCM10027613_40410 [Microlunatus endophyticus]
MLVAGARGGGRRGDGGYGAGQLAGLGQRVVATGRQQRDARPVGPGAAVMVCGVLLGTGRVGRRPYQDEGAGEG